MDLRTRSHLAPNRHLARIEARKWYEDPGRADDRWPGVR